MEVLTLFLCSNSTIDLSINSWALRNDKSFWIYWGRLYSWYRI